MKVFSELKITNLGKVCIYPDRGQGLVVIDVDGFEFSSQPHPSCGQAYLAALNWAKAILENEIERCELIYPYEQINGRVVGNSNEDLHKLIEG